MTAQRLDLLMPSHWPETLAEHGWEAVGGNETYAFFERPGYWLRVSRVGHEWHASVRPERYKVPRPELGEAGYFVEFTDQEKAPAFKGRGSKARALEHAKALWAEHAPILAAIGIHLYAVSVMQWAGTGQGGLMTPKGYRAADLTM